MSTWLTISPPTIVIPSGRRSSEPVPVPNASGSAPNSAAIVVIKIGRKRSMHASKIESRVDLCSCRSATNAKSIIMIAFFFTMPISRMMPMIEITLRSTLNSINASIAPTLAEGSVEIIVIGCARLSYRIPSTM